MSFFLCGEWWGQSLDAKYQHCSILVSHHSFHVSWLTVTHTAEWFISFLQSVILNFCSSLTVQVMDTLCPSKPWKCSTCKSPNRTCISGSLKGKSPLKITLPTLQLYWSLQLLLDGFSSCVIGESQSELRGSSRKKASLFNSGGLTAKPDVDCWYFRSLKHLLLLSLSELLEISDIKEI